MSQKLLFRWTHAYMTIYIDRKFKHAWHFHLQSAVNQQNTWY